MIQESQACFLLKGWAAVPSAQQAPSPDSAWFDLLKTSFSLCSNGISSMRSSLNSLFKIATLTTGTPQLPFCHIFLIPVYLPLCNVYMSAKLLQLCLILCNPMDCSPPGSSVHGILQGRILEWVAMTSSKGSSQPRDGTRISYISCIGRWILYHWRHLGSPFDVIETS